MTVKRAPQRYRLEQWLDNPRCDKNAASAILNVPMQELAEVLAKEAEIAGVDFAKIKPLQFPQFAFEIGNHFEASLFEGDDPLLIERLLIQGGLLEPDSNPVVIRREEGLTTEEQIDGSLKLLSKINDSTTGRPRIVNGFKLPAEVLPPESTFEMDLLVSIPQDDGTTKIVVGEVKVYPDRGGRTDAVQVAGARSQAGLYVHVLKNWIFGKPEFSKLSVDGTGFLIFSEASKGVPTFAALENLEHQDRRAEVAISGISHLLNSPGVRELIEQNDPIQKQNFIREQREEYRESCWGHCAMAEVCFRKAVSENRTIVLGQKTEQQLSSLTLSRAVALADGVASPEQAVEFDLVDRFADARYPEIEGLQWKS